MLSLKNLIPKMLLGNIYKSLDKEFVKLFKKAEDESDLSLVIIANNIKRKNEEKKVQVTSFKKAIVISVERIVS